MGHCSIIWEIWGQINSMNSIEKSIEVLNYLSNAREDVSLAKIYPKLHFSKSTVHRILNILLKYSLIRKNKETLKYK